MEIMVLAVAGVAFFALVVARDVWVLSCWSGRVPVDSLPEEDLSLSE